MSEAWHVKEAFTKREILHQATIAARQDAKLRFFRKRKVAAYRQALNAFNGMTETNGLFHPDRHALVEAVRVQQNRNMRLGIA
jgi:hypothetical protein